MLYLEKHICVCGRCKLKANDKEFVAWGKKTKFVLTNERRKMVNEYIIDDCLLRAKKNEEKCDYLFTIHEDRIAYLIECKGSDILKAVDQLNSTLDILKIDLLGFTLKGRIVPTRVYAPNLATLNYKKLRERLNGGLETKNIICTERI